MGEESLGEGWAEEQEEPCLEATAPAEKRAERPVVRNQRDRARKEAEVTWPVL